MSGPRMYIAYRKLEDANSKLKAIKKASTMRLRRELISKGDS